jgi:hypothetical protein
VTARRSPPRQRLPDTVGPAPQAPTALRGLANTARADTHPRFRALDRCLDAPLLRDCWGDLNKAAVSGGDQGTAAAYAVHLQAAIEAWAPRRQTKRSRATVVRRCSLPTATGQARPRGRPARADKGVHLACAKLVTAR